MLLRPCLNKGPEKAVVPFAEPVMSGESVAPIPHLVSGGWNTLQARSRFITKIRQCFRRIYQATQRTETVALGRDFYRCDVRPRKKGTLALVKPYAARG